MRENALYKNRTDSVLLIDILAVLLIRGSGPWFRPISLVRLGTLRFWTRLPLRNCWQNSSPGWKIKRIKHAIFRKISLKQGGGRPTEILKIRMKLEVFLHRGMSWSPHGRSMATEQLHLNSLRFSVIFPPWLAPTFVVKVLNHYRNP